MNININMFFIEELEPGLDLRLSNLRLETGEEATLTYFNKL